MGLAAGLLLFLNWLSFYLACIAALLTCLYPLAKRLTYFPQLVLGITFNMGVLIAYAAYLNHIPLEAYLLYAATIFWTLAYDTFYAMSDMQDDLKLGIKSTAIKFGKYSLVWVCLFYVAFYGLLFSVEQNVFIILPVLYTIYLLHLAHKSEDYFKAFNKNSWVGLLVLLAIFIPA